MLIQILQIRTGLGIFVVAHPTFEEINVFATGRAAIGQQFVMIESGRALHIIRVHYLRRGRQRLLGRRVRRSQIAGRSHKNQNRRHGERHQDYG